MRGVSFPEPRTATAITIAGWPVTPTQILTPVGAFDRTSTTWTFGQLQPVKATPTWAAVGAWLLALFTGFLSLLLLLIKEATGEYAVEVTLADGRMQFRTTVYVDSYDRYLDLARAAAWAQGFAVPELPPKSSLPPGVVPLRRTSPGKLIAIFLVVVAGLVLVPMAVQALLT
jgi:hypothetical protein